MKYTLLFFFLISITCFSQIEDGLLLHYKFDGNALDSSGNEFHGTPYYVVTYTEDRFGNENSAVFFNGINSYIDFPNLQELKPELPVSFSFWIRFDGEEWESREVFNTSHEVDVCSGVYFNTEASSGRIGINYGDGSPTYNSGVRRTYLSNTVATTGEWMQVTAVIRGATDMNIFINCKESGGTYTGGGGDLAYSFQPGSLGRNDRQPFSPTHYFHGAIDDFQYWDRELTQEEIYMVCSTLGIEKKQESAFTMYPNPAHDKVFFSPSGDADTQVVIFDSIGNLVHNSHLQPELDISHLSGGIYIVKISNAHGSSSKKLIIKD